VSDTFIIPVQKKRAIIQKPSAPNIPYSPEPALSPDVYRNILTICRDTGIEIERHPGIYQGKDEETLRDHFLMVLAPHFESVTGETFNKQGKTDILVRHEGKKCLCCRVQNFLPYTFFLLNGDMALNKNRHIFVH